MQIGQWTLKGFREQEPNIALYLKLNKKNVDTLADRDLGSKFQPIFNKFQAEYKRLEHQYYDGIEDHKAWANDLKDLAKDLTKHSSLI